MGGRGVDTSSAQKRPDRAGSPSNEGETAMISTRPIRVLCVDDHAFLVEGLQARLALEDDVEFCGWISSPDGIEEEVQRLRPDVILMDIEMPGPDPFAAVEDLKRRFPQSRVIMLSAHVRDHYIDSAARAGAWGYMSKNDQPNEIVNAIRGVSAGKFVFGPKVMERCEVKPMDRKKGAEPAGSKLGRLTSRESEVLRMIGRGLTRAQIAKEMHRSPKTIDTHRMAIMEKLDIHDRGELVRFAIREGLAEV
jgi:DNA-binding NarL/FixJ family response regulator